MSKYLDPTISCFSKSADCAREKLRVAQQQHLWTQQDLAAVGAKGASSVGESLKAQASCDPGNMMLARGCEEMEEERSPIHDARDMTPSSILWGLKRSVVWVFLYDYTPVKVSREQSNETAREWWMKSEHSKSLTKQKEEQHPRSHHQNDAPFATHPKHPHTKLTTVRALVLSTATPNVKHHNGSCIKKNIDVCARK